MIVDNNFSQYALVPFVEKVSLAGGDSPSGIAIQPQKVPEKVSEDELYNYLDRTLYWLQPVCDFRLNVRDLFDRQTLSLHSPHKVFQNLVVSHLNSEFKPHETVWMRVFPEENSYLYRFIDPHAVDLKKCGHVFCRLDTFENGEASLDEIAAPSFSGKKVIQLVQNFIKAWGIKDSLIYDGSTVTGCCMEGAPSSLKMASILKTGKSWYELQGTSHRLAYAGFRKLIETRFVDGYYESHLTKPRRPRHRNYSYDYDSFCSHILSIHQARFLISQTAYREATSYLRSLKLVNFLHSLEVLVPHYPQLSRMQSVLKKIAKECGAAEKTITLGGVLDGLEKREPNGKNVQKDSVKHAELHEFRDYIVANKDSVFFQYIIDTHLQEAPSLQSLTYACCILDYFFCTMGTFADYGCLGQGFDLDGFVYEQVLANMSPVEKARGDETITQIIKKAKGAWADAYIQYQIKNEHRNPASAKILAHSNDTTRRAWIAYRDEIGIKEPFLALESAVKHFAKTPLDMLQKVFPELVIKWRRLYGEKIQEKGSIKDILKQIEGQFEQYALIQEFTREVRGSLSRLAVQQFEEFAKKPSPKDVYPLFMFAKYLCEKAAWTHLSY